MIAYLKQFVNTLKNPPKFSFFKGGGIKVYLILANVLLVFFLILLSNAGVLPFKSLGDFIFFSVLFLAFALYRPGWAFLFFIGTVALENINLAPENLGISVRPYQFIGGLTILAVLIKLAVKRLGFKLPKWNWADGAVLIFTISGFISALGSPTSKLAIIVASFVALYFLVRIFIQNIEDLKKIVPFFLSSAVVVVFYGIWQNIRFMQGLSHFETMPGRPNGTFTEPDWLGIYLVLLLAAVYSMIYFFKQTSGNSESVISNFQFPISKQIQNSKFQNPKNLFLVSCFLFLVVVYILLILTVSRSAWLGVLAVTFIFLFIIFTNLKLNFRNWAWKETLKIKIPIIACAIVSIAIVYIFNLTSFQLFNRAQSTGTGLQKITISCKENPVLPEKVKYSEELIRYGCRHINLEEIKMEEARGYFIKEIYRDDPNINIRSEIYRKSWAEIKKHSILGIGWGNIGKILGSDERGAMLNSSNIFLEIWLGAGIAGLLAFLVLICYAFLKSIKLIISSENDSKTLGLFLLLGSLSIMIPNLFNAGILLGFVWVFLAIAVITNEDRN